MKIIERPNYMNRLINLKGTPDIKIITGVRRAGKSKLMKAYIEYISKADDKANIIFIDFTDLQFDDLKTYKNLNNYINIKFISGKNNYVFIDEVQLCNRFELVINSLYSSEKFDLYITGSNAFLLSADLATLFTGRYIEIHVFPFSFEEYMFYHAEISNIDKAFNNYVREGGFAGAYPYLNERDRVQYLKDVYETIVNRDLIQKYNLSSGLVMDKLAEYLMDNISNLTSVHKVSETLNTNAIETTHVTIGKYIKYLCNAFIFYEIKRYDIKGKKYLETSNKYYLCDSGLRYAILGTRNMDYGRVYENLVYLELLRRGYEIYIGKLYEKEVDFVALNEKEKIYIQVSDNISSEDTFRREYDPLLRIKDAHPKIIIANTKHDKYSYEGIMIYDIALWLLGQI
ncbi:MAG: ATP-binding protein [Acholeplasmatales bacterium]|jgi:predicted AAA+ superfamily ATPase|nr:ATP-binding protein [Acholeplasmatales bacterium]